MVSGCFCAKDFGSHERMFWIWRGWGSECYAMVIPCDVMYMWRMLRMRFYVSGKTYMVSYFLHGFLPLKQGISCTFFLQPIQCKHLVNPRVPRLLSLQEQSLFSLTGMVRIRGIIAGMGLISGYVVKYSNLPRLYAYHCISMYDYMYDCKKHIKAEIDRLTQKVWW